MPEFPTGSIDGAKITVIRNPQSQVDDIEQGTYDWMQNPPPSSRYAEVKDKYEGTQFLVRSTISTYYFWFNTEEAPFDDVKVRQAVNYAINSDALERIYAGQIAGTHQILPPGMPGYEKFDLYPYDLAKAKQMIKEASPSDMDITVWTDTESPNNEAGEYLNDVLQELGFNTTLKILNADNYFTVIGNATTADLDAGWSDWFEDYPHPNDFFQPLLSGESILPTNNGNFAKIRRSRAEQRNRKTRRRAARARPGSGLRRARQEIHGTSAVGAVRDPHAVDLRLRRDQPRQHHLQPDVLRVPDQFRIQVGTTSGKGKIDK